MRTAASMLLMLLIVPLAGAGAGHGSASVAGDIYVHFTADGPALGVQTPDGAVLPTAPDAALCDAPLRWIMPFTQGPIGDAIVWTHGLARDADMDPAWDPELTWYVETVQPGGDEPLAVPVQELRLRAMLRAGDTEAMLGQGEILAQGSVLARPTAQQVDGRHVHALQVTLDWQVDNTTVAAEDGMHLEVVLDMPTAACDAQAVGWRAYSDAQHRPAVRYKLFDPVRIDRLEPVIAEDAVRIVMHASSPWGRFDLGDPSAALTGPRGDEALPAAELLGDTSLEAEWLWDAGQAPNGSYRIDAVVGNAAGNAEATARSYFTIGGEPAPTTAGQDPDPTPAKRSPEPAVPLLAAALAALSFVRRR